MSFASLRRVLRSARKGLCSTCSKAKYPQLEAAGAGHVGCLIYTIETLGQLIKDEHNVTAMHVAARKGQIAILIYLIENNLVKGIDRARNGATPAHDAAGTGNLDCLRYVLSHTMASASDIDNYNATPLHWAVRSGHRKVVQWLVAEGHAPIDATTASGITPIHLAASKNHFEILRWLTGYAYKHYPKPRKLINARDKNGCTPLYHAAQAGRSNIIRWLAEKAGGDPTIRSRESLAPLHAATEAGHLEAVKYLFQFGSASAPGGIRTDKGACALHFAAVAGHVDVLKWLLDQKECSGNERDYYQKTPLHDAAEEGHIRIIQALCEKGADFTLMDIEGNTPKDLAEKSSHSKCVKYLATLMKERLPKGANGRVVQSGKSRRRLSRSKRSSGEVMDNYRHAPPHQVPVNVFEGEDDEIPEAFLLGEWETLRDLIGDEELEDYEIESAGTKPDQAAEEKKRKLEEDMRRELEERKRKKMELLKKEKEVEMEIRERLLAEEEGENEVITRQTPIRSGHAKRISDPAKPWQSTYTTTNARRLSLPSNLPATSRGLVEKRTQDIENRNSPQQKKLLGKIWNRKTAPAGDPNHHLKYSQSWDSSYGYSEADYNMEGEDDLPEPPPLPSVQYLLGKRPVNIRKRSIQTLKEQIQERAATMGNRDETYDSDSHSSVGSSQSDQYKRHRRKHKKKKSVKNTMLIEEQERNILQDGSPVVKRAQPGFERFPTPFPNSLGSTRFTERMPIQQKIDFDSAFDEVTNELEALVNSPSLFSPAVPLSKAPLSSGESSPAYKTTYGKKLLPARQAPKPPTSPRVTKDTSSSQKSTKRGGPKLLPHQKNKQEVTNAKQASSSSQSIPEQPKPSILGSKLKFLRAKKQNQKQSEPQSLARGQDVTALAGKDPAQFVSVLSQAIKLSPKLPRFMRQASQTDNKSTESTTPMDIDEIESQLNEMRLMLESAAGATVTTESKRPPSPEPAGAGDEMSDTDSDSTEYTSSSDEETDSSGTDDSSSEDSSESDTRRKKPIGPRRPIMARNIGMAGYSRTRRMGFNQARMLSRYPRLLGRRIIHLETVEEASEEIIYIAKTPQERATTFHRLRMEQRVMKEWRKYIQIMKNAHQKADKMARRKRRELLAKAFYAWIQVRNMAAVEKVDMDKTNKHYERRLTKKVFHAWHDYSSVDSQTQGVVGMPTARSAPQQLLTAEEKHLGWLNEQLLGCGCAKLSDIGDSLADGVSIIKALSHASNAKPPKFNPNPKLPLHRQDNWKMAHEYMKTLGINVKGIEPADLAKVLPAAIHNMFNQIIKWHSSRQ